MASTYLSSPTLSSEDSQTFTFSVWVKKASLGGYTGIFNNYSDDNNRGGIYFFSDKFYIYTKSGGSNQALVSTNAVYRDTSSWYHLVVEVDTTQATDSDRVKLYVNGEHQTSLSNSIYPSQNANMKILTATDTLDVGIFQFQTGPTNAYWDGSMAHVHFIDGTAYDADTFGETDSTTGIWKPILSPSVTYGTNGFFLKFENDSAFGTDSSGNDNDFTVNGTMTQTIDTPSNVFATWNPLVGSNAGGSTVYYPSLENGNTKATPGNTNQNSIAVSTLGASSGKWYGEFVLVSESDSGADSSIGVTDDLSAFQTENVQTSSQVLYADSGTVHNRGSSSASGTSFSTGDIIGVALDLDNNYIYFSVNGTYINSGDPTSGATGTGGYSLGSGTNEYFFMVGDSRLGASSVFTANFGNGYQGTTAVSSAENPDDGIGIFEYDVPTGYRALCTKSINAEEYD